MEEQATEKQISFAKQLGIPSPEKYSKSVIRKMIDEATKKKNEKPAMQVIEVFPEEKTKTSSNHAAMYTSYAKDLFIAMLEKENEVDAETIMNYAIKLVKQAKQSFE